MINRKQVVLKIKVAVIYLVLEKIRKKEKNINQNRLVLKIAVSVILISLNQKRNFKLKEKEIIHNLHFVHVELK